MRRAYLKCCLYGCMMIAGIAVYSCSSQTDSYNKLVKQELASGKRTDSLFMGIYLGMTRKAFYDYCWQMNKKGIFTDGAGETMVQYKIPAGLKHPGTMLFYPDFYEEKIFHLRTSFQYDAWAPWNKDQFSDSLLTDLLGLYKKWYPGGNAFIKMTDKEKRAIYVKVDGNRRIILGIFSDVVVKADYTDLLVETKLQKKDGVTGAVK